MNSHEILIYAQKHAIEEYASLNWYQKNPNISIPLIFTVTGIFQFIQRKWVFPVSINSIEELEDQFPTQGLIYQPEFGLALIFIGVILLGVLNIF